MSEEERLEEDKKLGKFDEKDKPKWKFMQVNENITQNNKYIYIGQSNYMIGFYLK